METLLNKFKAKGLLVDPAFYVALVPIIAYLDPHLVAWYAAHKILLAPLLVVLAGHFGVRAAGTIAAGKTAAALAPTPAQIAESNPASGAADLGESIPPGDIGDNETLVEPS